MNILRMVNRAIKKIEEIIIAYAIIAITLILFINVITREFFDYSWKAAEETSIFLVIAVTFMAVSYASRKGKHITMTIFLDLVPNKYKKILATVNSFLSCVSLLFVAKVSLDYVIYVMDMGRITSALSMPAWWPLVVMPVGLFLSAVQFFLAFLQNVKNKGSIYIGPEATYGASLETEDLSF